VYSYCKYTETVLYI